MNQGGLLHQVGNETSLIRAGSWSVRWPIAASVAAGMRKQNAKGTKSNRLGCFKSTAENSSVSISVT